MTTTGGDTDGDLKNESAGHDGAERTVSRFGSAKLAKRLRE